jgi:hypothetical protein
VEVGLLPTQLAGDEVIVNPRGRGADVEAGDEHGDGGGDAGNARAQRPGAVHREGDRGKHERDEEEDRRHEHRDDAGEHAHRKPRIPPRRIARPHEPPDAAVECEHEPDGGHQDDREGHRREEKRPTERRGDAHDVRAHFRRRLRRRIPAGGEYHPGDEIEQQGDGRIGGRLDQADEEGIEARRLIDGREEVGVAGQAVERLAVGELAARDSQRPVIVELHVVAIRQEVRGVGEADEDDEPDDERQQENPRRG